MPGRFARGFLALILFVFTGLLSGSVFGQTVVDPARDVPIGGTEYVDNFDAAASNQGRYSTSVPIQALPGRNGMTSNLSFEYNSGGPNGPLGIGWSIGGTSTIERRGPNGGVATMTAADRFYVDGVELVAIAGGTYRTVRNDYVTYIPTLVGGYFRCWKATTDGYETVYGDCDSDLDRAVEYLDENPAFGGTKPVRFNLHTKGDIKGVQNQIRYVYAVNNVTADSAPEASYYHLLSSVTANVGVGTTATHSVFFEYGDRDDMRVNYDTGHKRILGERLKRVRVVRTTVGGSSTSAYYLMVYDYATKNNQSRLTDLLQIPVSTPASPPSAATESGFVPPSAGGACSSNCAVTLADMTYSDSSTAWGTTPDLLSLDETPTVPPGIDPQHVETLTEVVDVNGDARADLVFINQSCHLKSSSADFFRSIEPPEPPADPSGSLAEAVSASYGPPPAYDCFPFHQVYLNVLNSSGMPEFNYNDELSTSLIDALGATTDEYKRPVPWAFLDVNRDGFVDVLRSIDGASSNGQYALGTTVGWTPVVTVMPGGGTITSLGASFLKDAQYADLNGDGFVDRFRNTGSTGWGSVDVNTGSPPYFDVTSTPLTPPLDGEDVFFGNAGGDEGGECMGYDSTGIRLAWRYGKDPSGTLTMNPADDTGMTASEWVWMNTRHVDVNGDGKSDLVVSVPNLMIDYVLTGGGGAVYKKGCNLYTAVVLGDGRGNYQVANDYGFAGALAPVDHNAAPTADDLWADESMYEYDAGGGVPPGSGDATKIDFSYPLNNVAFADVDSDGYPELFQYCQTTPGNVFTNKNRILWDRGMKSAGGKVGYQLTPVAAGSTAYGDCPSGSVDAPIDAFGVSSLGAFTSTMADVDGDGDPDVVVVYRPYMPSTATWAPLTKTPMFNPATERGVYLYQNYRSVSQGQVLVHAAPRGGNTTLTWSHSAQGDNAIPMSIEHLATVASSNGITSYTFSKAGYGGGEFMGFGYVETLSSRKSRQITDYATTLAMKGSRLRERLIDENGDLKNLRVYDYIGGTDTITFGKPYYFPLARECEYEFGNDSGIAGSGASTTSYVGACLSFGGEGDWLPTPQDNYNPAIHEGMENGNPRGPSQNQNQQAEAQLEVLRALAMGANVDALCDPLGAGAGLPLELGGTFIRKSLYPDTGACDWALGGSPPSTNLPSVTYSNTSKYGTQASPASHTLYSDDGGGFLAELDLTSGTVFADPTLASVAADTTYRMYVTEFDYDEGIGHVVNERRYRNTDLRDDTLRYEYEYDYVAAPFNDDVLTDTLAEDVAATITRYEEFDYTSTPRSAGMWTTKRQISASGGYRVVEHRAFDSSTGEILTTSQPDNYSSTTDDRTTTNTWDTAGCGLTTMLDPLGYRTTNVFDNVCRVTTATVAFGAANVARTTYTYDGFGQVASKTVDPAIGSSVAPTSGPTGACGAVDNAKLTRIAETYQYDLSGSGLGAPASTSFYREPDGSETLEKVFVDKYGRTTITGHCKRSGTTGAACVAGTEVHQARFYSLTTGDIILETQPYLIGGSGAESLVHTVYDEFGRIEGKSEPYYYDLPKVWTQYAYNLGKRTVTDPLGFKTVITFGTISEETEVEGIDRTYETRNAYGQVTSRKVGDRSPTMLAYDGYNRLSSETLPSISVLQSGDTGTGAMHSPSTTFEYRTDDKLTKKTDPNGNVWLYEYDDGGRLTTTKDGLTPSMTVETRTYTDGAFGTRRVKVEDIRLNARYEYQDGLGRTTSTVTSDGETTTVAYDSRGRAIQTAMPWGERRCSILTDGGLTRTDRSVRGSVNAVTTSHLDARGLVRDSTDADGAVTTNAYDVAGRLTTTYLGDNDYLAAQYVYDNVGRVDTQRLNGVLTRFWRDPVGRVTTQNDGWNGTDALVTTTTVYRDDDQLDTQTDGATHATHYGYNVAGWLTSMNVDALPAATTEYDKNGNVTRVTDPVGLQSYSRYDSYDRVIGSTPPGLGEVTYEYEPNNATLTPPTDPVLGAPAIVKREILPTGEVTTTYTDGEGRVYLTCDAANVCVSGSYDESLLKYTRRHAYASGTYSTYATQFVQYAPSSSLVSRRWDWMSPGEVTSHCTNPAVPATCSNWAGVSTTYTAAGRTSTITDSDSNVTTATYASETGLLVGRDLEGVGVTSYAYGPSYPVVTGTTLTGTDSTSKINTTFDLANTSARYMWPASITRTRGTATEKQTDTHDGLGRVSSSVHERAVTGSGTDSVTVSQTYATLGGVATRGYSTSIAGTAGASGTFAWTYRDNGQPSTLTYPSGLVTRYIYQAGAANILTVRDVTVPAATKDILTMPWVDVDQSGRPKRFNFDGTTLVVTRTFDASGREASRAITDGTNTYSESETTSPPSPPRWDSVGRLQHLGVNDNGTTYDILYGYNSRDYLTSEQVGSTYSGTYGYDDKTAHRTARTSTDSAGTVTFSYGYGAGNGNRLTSVTSSPGSSASLSWDAFGRQTTDEAGLTYTFGLANQLLTMKNGATTLERNLFDSAGVRVVRVAGGATEYFFSGIDGPDNVLEHIEGSTTTDYVRLPGGASVAEVTGSSRTQTPIVRSLTGNPYRLGAITSGNYVNREWSGFGETKKTTGTHDTDLDFHGMLKTASTQVKQAGVRAYSTTLGRFLSPDRLVYASAPDINDSIDLYAYAHNNPVSLMDPSGLYIARPPRLREISSNRYVPMFTRERVQSDDEKTKSEAKTETKKEEGEADAEATEAGATATQTGTQQVPTSAADEMTQDVTSSSSVDMATHQAVQSSVADGLTPSSNSADAPPPEQQSMEAESQTVSAATSETGQAPTQREFRQTQKAKSRGLEEYGIQTKRTPGGFLKVNTERLEKRAVRKLERQGATHAEAVASAGGMVEARIAQKLERRGVTRAEAVGNARAIRAGSAVTVTGDRTFAAPGAAAKHARPITVVSDISRTSGYALTHEALHSLSIPMTGELGGQRMFIEGVSDYFAKQIEGLDRGQLSYPQSYDRVAEIAASVGDAALARAAFESRDTAGLEQSMSAAMGVVAATTQIEQMRVDSATMNRNSMNGLHPESGLSGP